MYVLITAGEVMFSITGLDFAYSQVSEHVVVIVLLTIRLDRAIMICGYFLVLLKAQRLLLCC